VIARRAAHAPPRDEAQTMRATLRTLLLTTTALLTVTIKGGGIVVDKR
jgi:hypothetical protein